MTRKTLLTGSLALTVIWSFVWVATSWSGRRKATPQKVVEVIMEREFEDWSGEALEKFPSAKVEARRARIDKMASVVARLDIRQRKELNDQDELMSFFPKLCDEEKLYFMDSVVFDENVKQQMQVFDRLNVTVRGMMVRRSMRELDDGPAGDVMKELKAQHPEVMEEIIELGFLPYYENASLETKMKLSGVMIALGEAVQGFTKPGGGTL